MNLEAIGSRLEPENFQACLPTLNTITMIPRITPKVEVRDLKSIHSQIKRKHFVDHLTEQSAIRASASRDDTVLNTVFQLPRNGQLVFGQIKGGLDGFLEELVLISQEKLPVYRCLKRARHWSAQKLDKKYAMFKEDLHFIDKCLEFDSVKFIDPHQILPQTN